MGLIGGRFRSGLGGLLSSGGLLSRSGGLPRGAASAGTLGSYI